MRKLSHVRKLSHARELRRDLPSLPLIIPPSPSRPACSPPRPITRLLPHSATSLRCRAIRAFALALAKDACSARGTLKWRNMHWHCYVASFLRASMCAHNQHLSRMCAGSAALRLVALRT